jgi:hypothetical protein
VSAVDQARQPVSLDLNGHHHIQAQNGEVVKVIPVERLGAEVGMYAAQALQATDALTDAFKWWNLEAFGITHHNRFDGPMPAD